MYFRMSSQPVLDSLSCFFDFLTYQKGEIGDTVNKLLDVKTDLLIDGMLICTCNLPTSNTDFKLFLRDFYTRPVILRDFSLDEGPSETIIRCKISYDHCAIVSKPLFSFSNQTLQNVQLIKKQLKNLNFSYKITKSHLWFQVMETDIQFFYNASLDKYATSPDGHSYNQFLNTHKNQILRINHTASVLMPGTLGPAPPTGLPAPTGQPAQQLAQPAQQPTQPAEQLAPAPPPARAVTPQSSHFSAAAAAAPCYETPRSRSTYGPPHISFARSLLPVMENLESNSPRCSVQGAAARLDLLRTTRLTNNCKVIKEIASDKGISLDTTLLSEMFSSPWNAKKTALLSLAMNGIIAINDIRSTEAVIVDKEKVTDDLVEEDWDPNAEENNTTE